MIKPVAIFEMGLSWELAKQQFDFGPLKNLVVVRCTWPKVYAIVAMIFGATMFGLMLSPRQLPVSVSQALNHEESSLGK